LIVKVVADRIPARFGLDPIRDVQVLCPMNRGAAGARVLNLAIPAMLVVDGGMALECHVWTGAPGDRQKVDGGSPSR